jgi:predicted cupin superfamily sugar epimerase
MKNASYWVEKYAMLSHPEGGYYVETYRSTEHIPHNALPSRFSGDRAFSTGIYFLLESPHFSAFHRIQADEMWHFYAGSALDIYCIFPGDGRLEVIKLGSDADKSEVFQAVVPAGTWFASRPTSNLGYALVGCTVAPGFDFADFEMADRANLAREFPQHTQLIEELTRVA